jgi:predicted secreted protein
MSNAVAGVGTSFRRWDNSTWKELAEITNIDGPTKSRDTIDVTSLDSVDGYREFLGSLRDGGTVSLSMNFSRDTYDEMNADYESDVLQNYEIYLPDAEHTSFEFEGLVTELGLGIPVDDKISSDVTIKISGKVVENSGSGSGTGTV